MKKTALFFSISMALWSSGHAFQLITVEEAAQQAQPPKSASLKKAAIPVKPPEIQINQPKKPDLTSPFDIDIRFNPEPGTRIKPETLKILYGWMETDITERVRGWGGAISAKGITAKGAEVPPGNHTLTIQITDDQERVGQTELSFSVSRPGDSP